MLVVKFKYHFIIRRIPFLIREKLLFYIYILIRLELDGRDIKKFVTSAWAWRLQARILHAKEEDIC